MRILSILILLLGVGCSTPSPVNPVKPPQVQYEQAPTNTVTGHPTFP